jgi:choline-sulfatase
MRFIYIDIDSLRPDHLGCYGYHRQTSPNIDAIAAHGVIFTNCYTPDAPCLPSRTALYTGRFGIMTGVVGHGGTAADMRIEGPRREFRDWVEQSSLASFLQKNGLYTAQISPFGQRHAARHFYAGFNEVRNTGRCGMESAEEVQPVVMQWLKSAASRDNWFLHINYWDVHGPYRVPLEYGEPFRDDPLPAWITDEVLERHQCSVGPHSALELNMYDDRASAEYPRCPGKVSNRDELRQVFDGYDTAVRYVDDKIGEIVAWLKANGIFDDTAIIISADHGENLGELGIYVEHATADHITCRVPLIIKWPETLEGKCCDALHYNLDLPPTLAQLMGAMPESPWDGQSFADSLTTASEDRGRDHLILSQCAHVCQRSSRWGEYLYMRTYHDGFHLFPPEMLFDITTDPHEQHNLADRYPELCREGLARLTEWHDERMSELAKLGYTTDPLWTVMAEGGPYHARDSLLREAGYWDHLERTGRGWAIEELRERHPDAF